MEAFKFYLNVVGYEVGHREAVDALAPWFYLNVVGYEDGKSAIDPRGTTVLSERSGI